MPMAVNLALVTLLLHHHQGCLGYIIPLGYEILEGGLVWGVSLSKT